MKKYVIERELPYAGKLTPEELQSIVKTSCAVVDNLGRPYHWIQSFVVDDKIYCIHIAQNEEAIREHAKRGGFPANKISEVRAVLDASAQ